MILCVQLRLVVISFFLRLLDENVYYKYNFNSSPLWLLKLSVILHNEYVKCNFYFREKIIFFTVFKALKSGHLRYNFVVIKSWPYRAWKNAFKFCISNNDYQGLCLVLHTLEVFRKHRAWRRFNYNFVKKKTKKHRLSYCKSL